MARTLTLKCDLELRWPHHAFYTSIKWVKHLSKVSRKTLKGYRRYGADTKTFRILTLKCDFELRWPRYAFCTLSQCVKHLSQVSRNSMKGYRRYGANRKMKARTLTLKCDLDLELSWPHHAFCTWSQWVKHLSQDSRKSMKWYRRNEGCSLCMVFRVGNHKLHVRFS